MKTSILALAVIGSIAATGSVFAGTAYDDRTAHENLYNQSATEFKQASGYKSGSFAGQPSWQVVTNPNGGGDVREMYIRQGDGSLKLFGRTEIDSK